MQLSSLFRYFAPTLTFITRRYHYPSLFIQFLQNEPQPEYEQLENGLRIATLKKAGSHACLGLFCDIGSRYEQDFEHGAAHMFEHLVFKSTKNLTQATLQNKINSLGIKMHAYTSRELASYYVHCHSYNVLEALALLTECVINNALNKDDIQKEKAVAYQEIISQDRNPKALVFEYLHSTAFQGTSLANSVLGTSSNLTRIDQSVINRYLERTRHPSKIILCAVGAVEHLQIVSFANQYLSWSSPLPFGESLYRYTGSEVRYRNDALQKAHVAYALEGPSFHVADTVYMELAASMISGWGKTQYGGEEHAAEVARRASLGQFCDAYKSFNIRYNDTSLWGVQFVSASLDLEDMMYTIQDVLLGMCTTVTEGELERAKEELKTKMLYRTSSCFGAARDLAEHLLYNHNHWPALYDRMNFIDTINVEGFKKTLYSYVYNKCPAIAAVGATEGLPDYTRLRGGQYWLRF